MSTHKVKNTLIAARSCIALPWRDLRPPSVSLWLSRIEEVNKMEDLLLSAHNRHETYSTTWVHWNIFTFSEEGKALFAS